MQTKDVGRLIVIYADAHAIDPLVVAGVVLQESGGIPDAARVEEDWFERRLKFLPRAGLAGYVPSPPNGPSLFDEKLWRATSWGLMQIMGDRARILGDKRQYLPGLIHAEESLEWGCLYLAQLLKKTQGGLNAALLRWNGGGDLHYPTRVIDHIDSGRAAKLLEA